MSEHLPPPGPGDPVRVQILATEHWALLAARSTTQNELLARIALLLTVLSASLVTIGLFAQAVGPGRPLAAAAFPVVALVWLVGVLTLLRVLNASEDDAGYVLAMNRLRGAYTVIDPTVRPYLVQSPHDDEAGLGATYSFLPRSPARHLFASASIFVLILCAVLTGLLFGSGVAALGAAPGLGIGVGSVAAVAFGVGVGAGEQRRYARAMREWTSLHPTPDRPV